MPTFDDLIADFVPGDDIQVDRDITNVPAGDTLATAWFTVKDDPDLDSDAEAVIQKVISSVNNPGVGQITDTGADTVGHVRFDLTPADTIKLRDARLRYFDIQCKTTAGKTYTPVVGRIMACCAAVTLAT